MHIREFQAPDLAGIRSCVILLQDFERTLDPRMPSGSDIADEYLEYMFGRCRESSGTIFVAEESAEILGFVCILANYRSDDPDDGLKEYGLVSDFVVMPRMRGRGIGRALLERAEIYAQQANVAWLRVGLLAANRAARSLYSSAGYRPWLEYFEKDLRA